MLQRRPILNLVLLLPLWAACGLPTSDEPRAAGPALAIDSAGLLADIAVLAADSMEGRRTGTEGHARAQRFLLERFEQVGLQPLGSGYLQPLQFRGASQPVEGANLAGVIRGREHPDRFLVITAHYDHLGIVDGETYNGADDNASGTAALLALAAHFREHPPRHSLLFVATDAEEGSVHGGEGLRGARAFVASPPVPLESILVNVNLDMISRNARDELYAAGTYHYPALAPFVERVAERAPLTLRLGHDRPDLPPGDDWTSASDHGAFHAAEIPFLYFGVEDHPDYHRPSDTFENIEPGFYARAVRTVLDVIRELDAGLAGGRSSAHSEMERVPVPSR